MQTPSSGSSVQGEVSKPKGGAPSYHSSRTRGGGVGGSGLAASEQWGSWAGGGGLQGGGVEAESDQEWAVSWTEAQEQGKGCPTPLLTPMLLMTRV